MDGLNYSGTKVQYAVSMMIILYFVLAFYPKYFGDGREIIPFSLYNLYSIVPGDYSYMDLMILDECNTKSFLFYNNQDLSKIERKYFLRWLKDIADAYHDTKQLDVDDKIISNISGEVYLVKLTGDYIQTLDKGDFDCEIITRLK